MSKEKLYDPERDGEQGIPIAPQAIRDDWIEKIIKDGPFTFRIPKLGIADEFSLDTLDLTQQEMDRFGLVKNEQGKIYKKDLRNQSHNS